MITIKRFLWSVWLVLVKIRVRLTPGGGGEYSREFWIGADWVAKVREP